MRKRQSIVLASVSVMSEAVAPLDKRVKKGGERDFCLAVWTQLGAWGYTCTSKLDILMRFSSSNAVFRRERSSPPLKPLACRQIITALVTRLSDFWRLSPSLMQFAVRFGG